MDVSWFNIGRRIVFIYTNNFYFPFSLVFDEAIYIHWAQYVTHDWVWRNTSLTLDGKQPLFIWLVALTLKIIQQPIIAGRVVSVFCGGLSLVGLYQISKRLFNGAVGLITIILYSFIPFFLIYDGLALMDGLLLTLSIYASLLSIHIALRQRWFIAISLGLIIGLGLLTKSGAVFFILFLPLGILIFENQTRVVYGKFISLSFLAVMLAKGIEYIFLHDYFKIIANKNSEFVMSATQFLHTPFNQIINHAWQINSWIFRYLGISVLGLSIISLFIVPKKRYVVYLLCSVLLPLVPFMLLSKQAYPRHLLFMVWPLLILTSSVVVKIYEKMKLKKLWVIGVIIFLFIPYVYNDWLLLFNPLQTNLPEIEHWQLLTGEPSGWGIDQLYQFFDGHQDIRLLILTDNPIGILPDGMAIRYFNKSQVHVVGLDQIDKTAVTRFTKDYQAQETYLVLSAQTVPNEIHVHQELEIERPGKRNKNWRVYKVI